MPEVRFWCLQTVEEILNHKYEALTQSERAGLQNWLITLVCQASVMHQQVFLQNKLAQVYALLMRHEYPEQWQTPLTALLQHLEAGEHVIVMFLRVLRALDAEIINPECHRNASDAAVAMRVKDAIRLQCMQDIARAWYVIVEHLHASNVAVVKECLLTMSSYITWIDLELVANDQVLHALYTLLLADHFVPEVCACITALVQKKMEPRPKTALISGIILLPTIEQVTSQP